MNIEETLAHPSSHFTQQKIWWTSWAGGRSGCWAELLPGRWWPPSEVGSAPRRSWWPAEGDEGWLWPSCCPWQRSQPARGSLQWGTRWQQPGRQGLHFQSWRSSFPSWGSGGSFQQGTAGRPWQSLTCSWTWPWTWSWSWSWWESWTLRRGLG